MEIRVALFLAWIEGLGAPNSCRNSPMTMTKTERGRDGGRERFRSAGVHPEMGALKTAGEPAAVKMTNKLTARRRASARSNTF